MPPKCEFQRALDYVKFRQNLEEFSRSKKKMQNKRHFETRFETLFAVEQFLKN